MGAYHSGPYTQDFARNRNCKKEKEIIGIQGFHGVAITVSILKWSRTFRVSGEENLKPVWTERNEIKKRNSIIIKNQHFR